MYSTSSSIAFASLSTVSCWLLQRVAYATIAGPTINRSGNLIKRFLRHNRHHVRDVLGLDETALGKGDKRLNSKVAHFLADTVVPATPLKRRKQRKPGTPSVPQNMPMMSSPVRSLEQSSIASSPYAPQMRQETAAVFQRIKQALTTATARLSSLEPAPSVDKSMIQPVGVTQLPDKRNVFITDTSLGAAKLLFLPDYYQEVFGRPTPKRSEQRQQRTPLNAQRQIMPKKQVRTLNLPDSPK